MYICEGLDSDEIEIEFTGSGSGMCSFAEVSHSCVNVGWLLLYLEPTRWNVYDKERVVITSPPSLHG